MAFSQDGHFRLRRSRSPLHCMHMGDDLAGAGGSPARAAGAQSSQSVPVAIRQAFLKATRAATESGREARTLLRMVSMLWA